MKYEEMSDNAINSRVAMHVSKGGVAIEAASHDVCIIENGTRRDFDPCNNPSDAWPIIVDNMISIKFDGEGQCDDPVSWVNATSLLTSDVCMHQSNPLRAAMICFLKMRE